MFPYFLYCILWHKYFISELLLFLLQLSHLVSFLNFLLYMQSFIFSFKVKQIFFYFIIYYFFFKYLFYLFLILYITMKSCELVNLVSALSCLIVKNYSKEQIAVLAAVFVQLGDSLTTILVNETLCDKDN